MGGKEYVGALIYLGLLACALVYVKSSIDEYMSGRTFYSDTQAPISLYDIPTITFKFPPELKYGKNFIIQIYHKDVETIPSNQSTRVLLYDRYFKSKVSRMGRGYRPLRMGSGNHKLSLTYEGKLDGQIDFTKSFVLEVKFLEIPEEILNRTSWYEWLKDYERLNRGFFTLAIYFTSEENCYGISNHGWYDGKVVEHKLKLSHKHYLTIQEVTDYQNMNETCSKDSFFQSLAKRFANINLDQVRQNHPIKDRYGNACPFKSICSPILLPFDSEAGITICNNDVDYYCFDKILSDMKKETLKSNYCKKICHAREFKTIPDLETPLDGPNRGLDEIFIYVKFGFPESSIDVRPSEPFKTIKTEYLVVSWMSLLGNVGGTLGIFVGFSLTGASEWCLVIVQKLWKWFCARYPKNNDQFALETTP